MPQSAFVAPALRVEARSSLSLTERTEWQGFLATAARQHPRQDPRFAQAEQADGRSVLHVLGRDTAGRLVAVGLVSLLSQPFWPGAYSEAQYLSGPVCDDAATCAAFLEGMLQLPDLARVGRVKITPFWVGDEAATLARALSAAGWRPSEAELFRRTGWVDLTPGSDEILARFSKSARRELRRAERQGVVLHPVTNGVGAHEFLDSLNRLRRDRGLSPIAAPGFLAAFDGMYCAGDLGVILAARYEGTFVAGLQLYRGAHVAHGRQFTTEPARLRPLGNLRIAPLLWFEGMKWARDHGCRALDVEGWREAVEADDPKYNLYKYKSEFAPMPVRRLGEHSRTVNSLVDVSGNLKDDLRRIVRRFYRRLK